MKGLMFIVTYVVGGLGTYWVCKNEGTHKLNLKIISVCLAWPIAWACAIMFAIGDMVYSYAETFSKKRGK